MGRKRKSDEVETVETVETVEVVETVETVEPEETVEVVETVEAEPETVPDVVGLKGSVEIERKFLIHRDYMDNLDRFVGEGSAKKIAQSYIEQFYTAYDTDSATGKVIFEQRFRMEIMRTTDGGMDIVRCTSTAKGGAGLERREVETYCSLQQYLAAKKEIVDGLRTIKKWRYCYYFDRGDYGGFKLEINDFLDPTLDEDYMLMLEIEFIGKRAAETFDSDDFFMALGDGLENNYWEEVTSLDQYRNIAIAGK